MHEKTPLHTPALRSETGPVWFSFADSEGSGTHFFTFVPYQRRFLIIRRFSRGDPWGGRESPANRGIRRAIGRPRGGPGPTLPTGAQERPAPPFVQNLRPSGAQLGSLLELVQQIVAVEVSPAVHKHTILWIELPDSVASPVVINEQSARQLVRAQEFYRGSRIQLSLGASLVAHEAHPTSQGKPGHQQQNGS